MRADDPARRMHFVGMPTIDGDAERVTVHSYLLWVQLGAASPVSAAAEYTDTCVKQAGHWRFAARTLTPARRAPTNLRRVEGDFSQIVTRK